MEFYGEYMEIYGYAMGFYVIFWKILIFFSFDTPKLNKIIIYQK
tara:strand:- start:1810 stop:1941 length:132 start_codon:yes stop_codon:yes gene_type:complete